MRNLKAPTAAQVLAARRIVQRDMDIQQVKHIAKTRKAIGRYYKYSNSYSGGDRWWFYLAVNRMNDNGSLFGLTFQKTSSGDGEIVIKTNGYIGSIPGEGYIEITAAQFWKEAAKIRDHIIEEMSPPLSPDQA